MNAKVSQHSTLGVDALLHRRERPFEKRSRGQEYPSKNPVPSDKAVYAELPFKRFGSRVVVRACDAGYCPARRRGLEPVLFPLERISRQIHSPARMFPVVAPP